MLEPQRVGTAQLGIQHVQVLVYSPSTLAVQQVYTPFTHLKNKLEDEAESPAT